MKKILGESDIKVLAVTGGRDFETQNISWRDAAMC